MRQALLMLSRLRNRYLLIADILLIALMPSAALWIRMETVDALLVFSGPLLVFTGLMLLLKPAVFLGTGFYTHYWPYAGVAELLGATLSMLAALVAEAVLAYAILFPGRILPAGFPRSLPIIDGVLTAFIIGSSRLLPRLLAFLVHSNGAGSSPRPVLIAGAGVAGRLVAKELLEESPSGLVPIGFVDDDPVKIGKKICGLYVLGGLSDLKSILAARKVSQVVIAMAMAPGKVIRDIAMTCKDAGVESVTVPGLLEILRGSARVEEFRRVEVTDLIRRGTLKIDGRPVAALLQNTRVMVTGAGGSIGAEICRQVRDFHPSELILLGHGENSVFSIARELRDHAGHPLTISRVIADIRDMERMKQVFAHHMPDIVFHAAAHKHVGLMQENLTDAVTNNVLGTRNLVEVCQRQGTGRFVLISSDKAVNPTSIMGVTKRVAEMIVLDAAARGSGRFTVVRFGNVLGSRGSVTPIFQQQIQSRGPVTVSHPDVRRYFMTIPEAVQLVLQAATLGKGGGIYVLDMGEQIRVADLARDMIRLAGLQEGQDIEIRYTGLVAGEKMAEELFYKQETVEASTQEKVLVCRNARFWKELLKDGESLARHTELLCGAARQGDEAGMLGQLRELVPQFTVSSPAAPAPGREDLTEGKSLIWKAIGA